MIRDAEAHSEEDKKFEEMVTLRNQADGLIHGARKAVEDAGDKATDEEKIAIEAAAADLEEALKGDDKDAIEEKTKVLSEASAELAQKMYAEQAQAAGDGAENAPDGDAVDAEFEEVKDDKEQKQ
jgi:molecular chaperone DnaK